MINLTVKTLDSQNHVFSVEDEITIAQFKEKIADTVKIPADVQRLIYCGRVLQDSTPLKDYDVDGKVIHLVQRPPPSSTPHSDTPEPPPQPQRRIRGLEYVGTVRLPVNGIENTLHALPFHNLANSRLNVARRMINRAQTVLNALENPNRQDQSAQNESQEDATPVFEARVLIPNAAVFRATEETFPAGAAVSDEPPIARPDILIPDDVVESIIEPLLHGTSNIDQVHSVSSTPEVISPLVQSTENLATADSEPNNATEENATATPEEENATAAPEENVTSGTSANNNTNTSQNRRQGAGSRTVEFAEVLDALSRLNTRFVPFLEMYTSFMREDPVVQQENLRATQAMINRVSEVCHYLGHAYHSVSDIILRARSAPPRHLLCRPMLIQHSAVVQAQINIPTDRNPSTTTTSTGSSTASSRTPATSTTPATTAVPTSASDIPLNGIMGIPFVPRSSVRVESYRLPLFEGNILRNNNNTPPTALRSILSPITAPEIYAAAAARPLDGRARVFTRPITNASGPTMPSVQTIDMATALASNVVNSLSNITVEGGGAEGTAGGDTDPNSSEGPSNPNLEFFMEVTPETITIDSLETTFVGAHQANDLNALLQDGINSSPPPEFLHSIIQMAGQFMARGIPPTTTSASTTSATMPDAPSSSTITSEPTLSGHQNVFISAMSNAPVTTSVGAARTTAFQNSQARGNTQTQPTVATHTRSTPRPHVHLAQHTMHAFDPFLPCNSHHVVSRRRLHGAPTMPQQTIPTRMPPDQFFQERIIGPLLPYNLVENVISSVRDMYMNSLPSDSAQSVPSDSAQCVPSNNVQSVASDNAHGVPSDNAHGVPSDNVQTVPSDNVQSVPSDNAETVPSVNASSAPSDSTVSDSSDNMQCVPSDEAHSTITGTEADTTTTTTQDLMVAAISWLFSLPSGDCENMQHTIANVLQNFPDCNYISGQCMFTDLFMILSRCLMFSDIMELRRGRFNSLYRVNTELRTYIVCRILDSDTTEAGYLAAVEKLISEWQWFMGQLAHLETRDNIDIVSSVQAFFRGRLPSVITLAISCYASSTRLLVQQIKTTLQQLGALLVRASRNGMEGVKQWYESFLKQLLNGLSQDLVQWLIETTTPLVINFISNVDIPETILQRYIVKAAVPELISSSTVETPTDVPESEAMQLEEAAESSITTDDATSTTSQLSDDNEPLPTVVLGSAAWHAQVPSDWVPIIVRDSHRQRKQSSQPPFSDAYLSGMPSKRRKLASCSISPHNTPQIVADIVRRAITVTGLTNVVPIDAVVHAALLNETLHIAYNELLRNAVQSELQNNEDFIPEQFPNARNFLNGHRQ